MNPPPKMSREEMLNALRHVGEKLAARGIEAQIYVVGGAAIAFAYGRERQTRDIDAVVRPPDAVFDAVREVTEELQLNEEWLNDTAKSFLPDVNIDEGPAVLEVPGLTVRVAPAEVILAMKLLARRPAKDGSDVRHLMQLLGITTREQLRELFLRYYPHGDYLDQSMQFIDALFD